MHVVSSRERTGESIEGDLDTAEHASGFRNGSRPFPNPTMQRVSPPFHRHRAWLAVARAGLVGKRKGHSSRPNSVSLVSSLD